MHLKYQDLARDIYGRPEIPVMTLQTMDRRNIGVISNATPPQLSIKFAEPSEISFDVAAYSDGVRTPYYDRITGHKILHTETYGIYLLLEPEIDGDGVEEVKHVKGYSLEKELEHKSFSLEVCPSVKFYTPPEAYNPEVDDASKDPRNTIIGRILEEADGWSVRYVSSSLWDKYCTLDEYDDYLLSFIYNTLPEKYRCVFVFDPYAMAFDVYDTDEARKTLGIYLDYDNLVTSLDIKELSGELVTAIRAYGADGLDTKGVNPIGTDWQYNLDYFIQNGDIPEETATHWKEWQAAILTNQERYRGLVAMNASETARKTLLEAELADLKSELSGIIDRQNIIIQQMGLETKKGYDSTLQDDLDAINKEKSDKEDEIAQKEEDIGTADEHISNYESSLRDINEELAFHKTGLFTDDERRLLSKFFIEKDITQESFVATDVDVNVSGALSKYSGLRLVVSGSDISEVDIDSVHKRVYAMRGGKFHLSNQETGEVTMVGNIVRATLDVDSINKYTMSIYGGSVTYSDSVHQSCVVTISGRLPDGYGIASNIKDQTEEHDGVSLTLRRGTSMDFNTGYDAEVYFTANLTDYQKMSVQMELFDYAADVLADLATPTYEFSVDTANFLFAQEFAPFRDVLELGSAIHLRISEDRVVTPLLIGVDVDFANLDKLSLTFSNRFKLHDSVNTLKDMLESGYSAGRTLDTSKYIYGRTVAKTTQVSKFMVSSLDVAKNAIVNANNQSVRIDSAGIHIGTAGGSYQLRMIDNMIAMTDDNWQHAKLAIGLFGASGARAQKRDIDGNYVYDPKTKMPVYEETPTNQYWGVNAEVIGGKLIVGNNLIIENVNDMGVMQFKVDASGAFLNNGVLCIQTDVAGTTTGRLLIDPRYGIAAGNDKLFVFEEDGITPKPSFIDGDGVKLDQENMPENAMFYLDIRNGKAYFRGTIYGDGGYFGGIVQAQAFKDNAGNDMLTADGKFDSDYLDLGKIQLDGTTGDITMTGNINMSGASKIDMGGLVITGTSINFSNAGSITWGKYEPRGVKSTVVTYAVSSSGTIAPAATAGWSVTIPGVPQGKYLWTKTVITYTDNTTSESYTVGYQGKNGIVDDSAVTRILRETYNITSTQIDGSSVKSAKIEGAEIYGGTFYCGNKGAFSLMSSGGGGIISIYPTDSTGIQHPGADPDKIREPNGCIGAARDIYLAPGGGGTGGFDGGVYIITGGNKYHVLHSGSTIHAVWA